MRCSLHPLSLCLVSGSCSDHREPQVPAVAQGEGHRRPAPRRDVLRRTQVGQEGRLPRGLRGTSRLVASD